MGFFARNTNYTYKGSTAKKDHEDDEGLKPVVLNNPKTGLP